MSEPTETPDWMLRAKIALTVLATNGMMERVQAEVDAFFAAHPDLLRTKQSEAIMTVLAFDRLSGGASNGPETQQNQNQKVA